MIRIRRILFAVSGLVPLLGLFSKPPDTALLIYTVYVAAYFGRRHLAALADRLPGPPFLTLCTCFLVSGSLTETFAWLSNYLQRRPEPALFHPQLFADLIVGVGFYQGWAVAWWLTLRFFRFTVAEAFLVTGLQGIFFEQLGAVAREMAKDFPTRPLESILMGLYVLAVHGSAVGLALLPVHHQFDVPSRSRTFVRFPVVIVLMVALAVAGCWLIAGLDKLFPGLLPPKQSIVEHPFW